jgi:hypothetical protein
MKAITVLLFISLLLVADGHSRQEPPAPSSTTQQTALVRGVLTDFLTGAGVGGATVLFERATGTQKEVISGKDGSYEALVPVDVYSITVRRLTYCSGRRAATHIGALPETKFDFVLAPCPTEEVGILVNGRLTGEEARAVNPFNYDSFKVRSELLLRFGTKRESLKIIDYQGVRLRHAVRDRNSKEVKDEYAYVGVMLSYELLTVYADKVKLTKESFEVEAQGNVIVEDAGKRTKANAVRITLRGDKPVIEILR